MVTFDNDRLFGSEAVRFKIGPVKLRHAVQHSPGSHGVRVESQGTEGRRIDQDGVFIANTVGELQTRIETVENKIDGLAYVLVDSLGRVWGGTILIEFDAETFERVGARWKVSYHAEYLQVIP